jgi:hypothetical protein
MVSRERCGRKRSWPVWNPNFDDIYQVKYDINFDHINRCPDRDSNYVPPEQKSLFGEGTRQFCGDVRGLKKIPVDMPGYHLLTYPFSVRSELWGPSQMRESRGLCSHGHQMSTRDRQQQKTESRGLNVTQQSDAESADSGLQIRLL